MTHDLLLHPVEEPGPDFEELAAAVADSETLGRFVSAEHSTPEQLVLTDGDTGVFLFVMPAPLPPTAEDEADADGEEGGDASEDEAPLGGIFHIAIPYVRPRFFAVEAARIAVTLAKELRFRIADPQDEKDPAPRDRTEEQLVESWAAQNHALLEQLAQPAGEGLPVVSGDAPKPVPSALLDAVFAHNVGRRELVAKAKGGTEVSRLVLAAVPARAEPAVVCRYTAGEPLWLPDLATHVVLARKKKGLFGLKGEEVLVDAGELRSVLGRWEMAGEAPAGLRAYAPDVSASDPAWHSLSGPNAKGLAVYEWGSLVDA